MKLALKESTEKVYILSNMIANITQDGKGQQAELTPQTIMAKLTTKDLLLAFVNVKKVEGMSSTEVFKVVKLIELIEEGVDEIELTDAQVETLKANAKSGTWAFASKFMRDLFIELGVEEEDVD